MSEEQITNPNDVTKFNASLAKVEYIMELMKRYEAFYVNYTPDLQRKQALGIAQHARYKIAKQLLVAAFPLLKEPFQQPLKEQIAAIKLEWRNAPGLVGAGKIVGSSERVVPESFHEAYIPIIDERLDEFIMELQMCLEKSGKYFTSKKGSGGLF